ncbi:hypothetical protein ECPA4_2016, partial [Escherichia coli PA4]
DQ